MMELKEILTEAQTVGYLNETLAEEEHGKELLEMGFRKSNAKIPGQYTSKFMGISYKLQQVRKVLHVECDKKSSEWFKILTKVAKAEGLFEKKWERHAMATETAQKNHSPVELDRFISMSQKYVNLQTSMIGGEVVGVTNIDFRAKAYSALDPEKVLGEMFLRHILYKYIKLSDKHSLFVEIHRRGTSAVGVDVVIPNTKEAKVMAAMMKFASPESAHVEEKEGARATAMKKVIGPAGWRSQRIRTEFVGGDGKREALRLCHCWPRTDGSA